MFSIGHADKRLRPESVDAVLIMRISQERTGEAWYRHQTHAGCQASHQHDASCTRPKQWRDNYSRFQERQI